jgi:hypothetical protein
MQCEETDGGYLLHRLIGWLGLDLWASFLVGWQVRLLFALTLYLSFLGCAFVF